MRTKCVDWCLIQIQAAVRRTSRVLLFTSKSYLEYSESTQLHRACMSNRVKIVLMKNEGDVNLIVL
jgi:hypothetical protein